MVTRTILLDVGGTFIKCSDGREIPIDSNGCAEDIRATFSEAVRPFLEGGDPAASGVAVAMPGPFNYRTGQFLMKHKFAAVYGEYFRAVAGIPDEVTVVYAHDVNGMLSGEMAYGNGRGFDRVALVTLGTGLGFSMSIDGAILMSAEGSPSVSIYNRPFRGVTLEDYVSKRGFLAAFERNGGIGAATVKEIGRLASEGNAAALKTFSEVAAILASELAPILADNGVQCLLMGGQISRSFRFMEEALREGLASVGCLGEIKTISDFDNATFNGLKSLLQMDNTEEII